MLHTKHLKTVLPILLMCCSLVAGRDPQCASKLSFVAQLSVNGCALFVHDTGESDGPHLAVEPLMCVTESLEGLQPRFDQITQHLYLSVPILIKDDSMLAEARRQLQHLSPRSVRFATVSNLSVSSDARSSAQIIGLLWSPDETTATLRLGVQRAVATRGTNELEFNRWLQNFAPMKFLSYATNFFKFSSNATEFSRDVLANTRFLATIISNGSCHEVQDTVQVQDDSFFDPRIVRTRYKNMKSCSRLRFIRTINLENCIARVHQRLDVKGHYLIEPLLCHNTRSLSGESLKYDFSRDMHYLKLDLVLQDNAALARVRAQLSDLSPRSVEFMRLWLAEASVSSVLSTRFEIGPLMVSADWRSAQLSVLCRTSFICQDLRSGLLADPVDFWLHVKWRVTSMAGQDCLHQPKELISSWRMKTSSLPVQCSSLKSCLKLCCGTTKCGAHSSELFPTKEDGRCFVTIQQRVTGRVSFQRRWAEYETGFGDQTDFWIGLSTINSLSAGGATLRVEIKLRSNTELHAEYAGFRVGNASTNYSMTYREMLSDRSNVGFDGLARHKGMQFSTMDRDNDKCSISCSNTWGNGGWWFECCHHFNPNGLFPTVGTTDNRYMIWNSGSSELTIRSVRLLLQI